ncbi:vacuolar sorting protein VPS33/slp1, partial [Serendipita sp. 411]
RIIKDFTDKQNYASAWLYFTDRITERLLNRLVQSPANPYLQKVSDMYINFWAIESQVFSLYSPSHFFTMFSPPRSPSAQRAARDRLDEDLRFAARCIANVCIKMNENPVIRYYLPSHHPAVGPLSTFHRKQAEREDSGRADRWRDALGVGSKVDHSGDDHLCKILAVMVQEELDMYKRVNPDWPEPAQIPRPQSVMLITDRTMDMIAPFVHEFTYQAMANDLLPIINGNKFQYEFQGANGLKQKAVATLSENDSLWVETRHLHIKETIDKIIASLTEFNEANGVFSKTGTTSIEDVKDMLAGLGQYQEGQEQFSLHYNMAAQCMDLFGDAKRKLAAMANVEQNCATGQTAEGKAPKMLVEEMIPLLADADVLNLDKVRVVALYIMYRDGVPEEDRRRLFEHCRLSRQERAAIDNLGSMFVRVTRAAGERDTRRGLKNRLTESDYDLSRYRPLLKTVLEDMIANKLDPSLFPYVKDPGASAPSPTKTSSAAPPTSLRNKATWTKAGARPAAGGRADNRQRVFVFVAGGMTYSEIRCAYEISASTPKDVYIGSTHTLIPEEFIEDLKTLDGGAGQSSKSASSSLPEDRSAQTRPFQVYYDQRYYTKDEPPPPPKPTPNLAPPSNANSSSRPSVSSANSGTSMGRSNSPAPGFGSGAASETDKKDKAKKKRFLGF